MRDCCYLHDHHSMVMVNGIYYKPTLSLSSNDISGDATNCSQVSRPETSQCNIVGGI
jgi:hypothetical protein